jgi:hypothetical protein
MSQTVAQLQARISALEAFICDVVRSQTFTHYGRTEAENKSLRTPLGNRAAVLVGMAELPTNGGLNTELDSIS